jgi:hypothetical protein
MAKMKRRTRRSKKPVARTRARSLKASRKRPAALKAAAKRVVADTGRVARALAREGKQRATGAARRALVRRVRSIVRELEHAADKVAG